MKQHHGPAEIRLISWNLLHKDGAALAEVARLIEQYQPDLLMMQEATTGITGIDRLVGGTLDWEPLPDRRHGLAAWTARTARDAPRILALPAGAMVRRISQIVEFAGITFANVHLSHGQLLNRRQLRFIAGHLPAHAVVVGDYNMVGPTMLAGFHDAGPRLATHRMSRSVPLRLDRCLIRGVTCLETSVLSRGTSDHHPIMLRLQSPQR